MEYLARAAADLATKQDVDMATVLDVAQQHGSEMLGPVPAANARSEVTVAQSTAVVGSMEPHHVLEKVS